MINSALLASLHFLAVFGTLRTELVLLLGMALCASLMARGAGL